MNPTIDELEALYRILKDAGDTENYFGTFYSLEELLNDKGVSEKEFEEENPNTLKEVKKMLQDKDIILEYGHNTGDAFFTTDPKEIEYSLQDAINSL